MIAVMVFHLSRTVVLLFLLFHTARAYEDTSVQDDLVNDLQKFKKSSRLYQMWSSWSVWSDCSKSCDRGVRHKLRRCLGKQCKGAAIRHDICNSQACPKGSVEYRTEKCSEYDKKLYRGLISDRWLPVQSDREPCALLCKSFFRGYTVRFEDKVLDGTPCKNGSRDVCIDGKCVKVGCDNVLESGKAIDDCGVCGGDGLSCGRPVFLWKETYKFSPCDKTCGPDNWRVSISACWDVKREVYAPEQLCADKIRPRPKIEKCPYRPCPSDSLCEKFVRLRASISPEYHQCSSSDSRQTFKEAFVRWLTGNWKECNVTCGGGHQWRDVYCAERHKNSEGVIENRKVPDGLCFHDKKPIEQRQCNMQRCPIWEVGDWSQCTVTCGKGTQVRKVACRQERFVNMDRNACSPKDKPRSKQICYTGVSCTEAEENSLADYERYRYVAAAPFSQWDDGGGLGGNTGGLGAQPKWIPDQWKECSTTCGPGVRTRHISCMAVQVITGATLNLPDYECEGSSKPAEFEPCELRKCSDSAHPPSHKPALKLKGQNNSNGVEYRWDFGPWSPCSASCLGGKQRSSLKCVELNRGKSVAWSYCNPKQRPAEIIKTCNNKPCPPQWDIGAWSVCSASCGGGLRTRKVGCIRVISSSDSLILPDGQCGGAKPRDSEPCGLQDCPAQWDVGEWNPCSVSCGSGEQRRLVICEQTKADGKLHRYNIPTPCQHLEKPPSIQLCNLGACPTPTPALKSTLKNFEQVTNHRRLTLRIGGVATLYQGTSVKIKCPVRNFDRSRIHWTKNGKLLESKERVKVSKLGALRIFNAVKEDAGVYACIAGKLKGNITLFFKPHKNGHENKTVKPPNVDKVGKDKETNRVDGNGKLMLPQRQVQESAKQVDKSVEPAQAENRKEEQENNDGATPTKDVQVIPSQQPKVESESKSSPLPDDLFRDRQVDKVGSPPKTQGKNLLKVLKEYLLKNKHMAVYDALRGVHNVGVVKTEWIMGDWSSCTQTCGHSASGMQFRPVRCKVDVNGYATYVEDRICIDFRMSKPHEAKLCGVSPCPIWKAGSWTSCKQSRCVRYSTAIQRREVNCQFPNGTAAQTELCNKKTRPSLKKECFNSECSAEWRATNWGRCSRSCGAGGVEMRTVACVWHGTRKAAGNNCPGSERPKILRPCRPQPACPKGSQPDPAGPFKGFGNCTDMSRYCDVIKLLKLCHLKEYSQKCCLTCTYVTFRYKKDYTS